MSKQVVVITGSPRENGNSNAMAKAFMQAAEQKGYSVVHFDATKLHIGGCHDCKKCFQTGNACVFDDDFNTVAPAILSADVVVFAMPVYWYAPPAQIKLLIDKMYSFCVAEKAVAGKQCGLIACCEEEDMAILDSVRIPMERSAAYLKWNMFGEVLIPGVLNVGDIDNTDGCARAAKLADLI